MASVRGRGRGRGGGGGGDGSQGSPKRGSWRGGPPGSGGGSRANTPVPVISGPPTPANGPRMSINDHMGNLGLVDDKARKTFQTDADIAGSANIVQRDLQRWVPDGPEPKTNGNGNANNGQKGNSETFGNASTGAWDQFETNKRLFGGESTYDENLYTTRLDKSGPDYKKKEKEADRLAKEIMGQSSTNSHIAEERGQATQGNKDEEEKYSGVARNPNAYVPPNARGGPAPGGFAAAAARGQAATATPPNGPKATTNGKATPAPAAAPPAAAPIAVSASNNPALPATPAKATLAPADPAGPTRSTSAEPGAVAAPTTGTAKPSPANKAAGPADAPSTPAAETAGAKDGLMGSALRFLQDEKKTVRDRQFAELKKFNETFKVALPVPEDMLPILSNNPDKQKEIQAKAAQSVIESKANALKSPKPPISSAAKPPAAKRLPHMTIQAIPPFGGKPKPAVIPIPPTAGQNIALAPGQTGDTTAPAKKLNPTASTFTFKPNPTASAFTPGQPGAAKPGNAAPPGTAGAGPSNVYRNPFFSAPPRPVTVNKNTDFIPWAHGPVPPASSIAPQWPYSGGARWPPQGPHGTSDVDGHGHGPNGPMMMPGMHQLPFVPYPGGGFRNPMPPPNMGQPMFSPTHGYAQLPGPPMHMGGPGPPQQPNGMPMYYQNGMPPQFMSHQMPFNPSATPRQSQGPLPGQGHGPGPNGLGQGQGGPPHMYYPNGPGPGPQLTPHMQHNMQFPPPQHFQQQQQQQPMLQGQGQGQNHGPGGPGQQPGGNGGGGYISPPNAGGPGPGPGPGQGQAQGQGRDH